VPRERGLTYAAADLCCAQASADSAAAQGAWPRLVHHTATTAVEAKAVLWRVALRTPPVP
jgi:hypothetical protein